MRLPRSRAIQSRGLIEVVNKQYIRKIFIFIFDLKAHYKLQYF